MSADPESLIVDTWNFDDTAGSADAFATLADRARSVSDAVVLRTQQARAIGLVGGLDGPEAAMAINRQGITEAQASSDPAATRWLGSLLNNLGWTLSDAGRPADALAVFEQALQARIDAGQTDRVADAQSAIDETRSALGQPG